MEKDTKTNKKKKELTKKKCRLGCNGQGARSISVSQQNSLRFN